MADLQDDIPRTTEVGEDDALPDDPFRLPQAGEDVPAGDVPAGDLLERARALLAGHPVADGYSGLPWALRHLPGYDLQLGEAAVDTDLPRMRAGHVGALFWSLHLPEGPAGERPVAATLEQLDLVRSVVEAHPEGLRLVRTAGQVIDARNRGRVAVLLGPAHGAALDGSLAVLRVLHALGVRLLTLAGTDRKSVV